MKKYATIAVIVLCTALLFTSCGQSSQNRASLSSSSEPISSSTAPSQEEPTPPSAEQEPSEPEVAYYTDESNWPKGPDINGAPVMDLTNLKRITEVYVWPLTINGAVWSRSWSSPSEIPANELIYICSFNGWVEYDASDATVQPFASAEEVEAALQKHFDVTTDYLRTSTAYRIENNTYPMIDGGGGWGAFAMAAEKEGNWVTIKVGSIAPEETIPKAMGTLVIELTEQNIVKYHTYQAISDFNASGTPESIAP